MYSVDRYIRVNLARVNIFILGLALAQVGFCQESSLNAAMQAHAERDWNTVIQLLMAAPAAADRDRLLGLAYYQLQQPDQALPLLKQAAENNPTDNEVNAALLSSLIAERDFASAKATLAHIPGNNDDRYQLFSARIASAEGDRRAVDKLYLGLLQSEDAELAQEAAAEYIEYLQQNRRYQEAYAIAQQAIRRSPDSFLSYRFRQVGEVRDEPQQSPWSFALGYRLEYDDNVALLPDGLAPTGTQDEEDFRHVVTADAIYQRKLGGNWMLFAEGRGTQSVHHQASEFNFTRLNGLLGTGQSFNRWGWRLPAEVSHDRFDGDSFSTTVTVSPGAYLRVSDSLYTHVYGRYAKSDFDLVAFPEDDRSAEVYGGGALFGGNLTRQWTLRSIVEYLDYDADGSNWDREEIQAYTYTEYNFTPKWSAGAGARYTDINFDNLNVPFLTERADESWEYYLSSTYQVAQGWYLRGQLTYVDHQSSIAAFDYQRFVASVGVSWRF